MTKKTGEFDKILGEKLLKYRLARKISRKDLADAIGITHQQIHKYEKGINRISVSRLYEICNFISVDPEIILETAQKGTKNNINIRNKDVIDDIITYIYDITDLSKLKAIKNLAKSMGEG